MGYRTADASRVEHFSIIVEVLMGQRVNPSSKLSNEKLQTSHNNVLMVSVKQCHRSVTLKEIGKAAIIAVFIRNFLKENNLMTVKNIFIQVDIYIFKVNNRKTRTRSEICSKITIKMPERRHWRRSGVFIVNFEQRNNGWDNSRSL